MQILATSGEIVPPGFAWGQENSNESPAEPWQGSLRRAIRSAAELRRRLQLPPAPEGSLAAEADFPTFVTEEFLSRIRPGDPDDPLLRQVLTVAEERLAIPGFVADPVGDLQATVSTGLIQKYAKRALVVATGACGIHCRYCFRREFDYSTASGASENWQTALASIRERTDLDEVILSGGDPLTLTDSKLQHLCHAIEAIPHVRRLRIHSRMPIVLPQRVTAPLLERLRRSRLAVWMVVHCNHAAEIDTHVEAALTRIIDAGIPVLNQAVLLRGVNDDVDVLEALCRRLIDLRVQPYYLHQLDRVHGSAHFEVPESVGQGLISALRSRLPGYAIPQYVREEAGRDAKTPVT